MLVKICGITRYDDARLALDLGAWAIGLIFYPPSPRAITPDRARALLAKLPRSTLAVGVFVDSPLEEVNEIAERIGLRGVQLHGGEPPEYAAAVKAEEVIVAFRVQPGFDPSQIREYRGRRILLDAYREGVPGGTGATFDWSVARAVQEKTPIILAGGLTPDNAAEAIRTVRPEGIDLSSGLESRPGEKDPEKLRRLFTVLFS